jgi:hypothetical protein
LKLLKPGTFKLRVNLIPTCTTPPGVWGEARGRRARWAPSSCPPGCREQADAGCRLKLYYPIMKQIYTVIVIHKLSTRLRCAQITARPHHVNVSVAGFDVAEHDSRAAWANQKGLERPLRRRRLFARHLVHLKHLSPLCRGCRRFFHFCLFSVPRRLGVAVQVEF